jgi:hypothetical protein
VEQVQQRQIYEVLKQRPAAMEMAAAGALVAYMAQAAPAELLLAEGAALAAMVVMLQVLAWVEVEVYLTAGQALVLLHAAVVAEAQALVEHQLQRL